jgi:hypothetical protein
MDITVVCSPRGNARDRNETRAHVHVQRHTDRNVEKLARFDALCLRLVPKVRDLIRCLTSFTLAGRHRGRRFLFFEIARRM